MIDYGELLVKLPSSPLMEVYDLPFGKKVASGKVREIFDCGEELLIIATDRLSAFDVVLPNGIPGKGLILTQIALFYFEQIDRVIDHHLVVDHESRLDGLLVDFPDLRYRSMLVKKLNPLPVEAIVRGYLAGSSWKEYQKNGTIWGHPLPEGLREGDRLPQALFTPSTKSSDAHDINITEKQCLHTLGEAHFNTVKRASLSLYQEASEYAEKANLILADTKFEFGIDEKNKVYLMDEILTPDSSRYWDRETYRPGYSQKSFDKQFIRDYLIDLGWDHLAPAPELPSSIIETTLKKYLNAARQLLT